MPVSSPPKTRLIRAGGRIFPVRTSKEGGMVCKEVCRSDGQGRKAMGTRPRLAHPRDHRSLRFYARDTPGQEVIDGWAGWSDRSYVACIACGNVARRIFLCRWSVRIRWAIDVDHVPHCTIAELEHGVIFVIMQTYQSIVPHAQIWYAYSFFGYFFNDGLSCMKTSKVLSR